jgi:ketosteroid isomerase-like protein
MSENLDLVRSIYASWERGDFGSAEWADPDIELVYADGPMTGRWTGIADMAQAWRDFLANWESYRIDVEGFQELDDERVLVLTVARGRGRTSGMEVAEITPRSANVMHVRGGKVTRLTTYWNRERALADLGLEDQATSTPHDPPRT